MDSSAMFLESDLFLIFLLAILVGAFVAISRRERTIKKFDARQRQDSLSKKNFIFFTVAPVFEGFNAIVLRYLEEKRRARPLLIIHNVVELLRKSVGRMSRERIFEELDNAIVHLEEHTMNACQIGQDGQIVFTLGCEIVRDLKRIPLEEYEGEYSFFEIIERVSRKLPEFEMVTSRMFEGENRSEN